MYDEQTVVIKDKTFSDTAVRELATTKARLLVYRYYHIEKEMKKFPAYQKLTACYSQMSDYDRLRVDNAAADLFALYMQNPDGFMPYKALKRKYRRWCFYMFCVFMLPACFLGGEFFVDAFIFGSAFDHSNPELKFIWVVTSVIVASCWIVAKLIIHCISDDELRIAKAKEMLEKNL
ncbi:MAG: hypothetical protein J6S81_02465 [Treponema sp.]|nr:hypothetical protein [Treponema sp.]